MSDTHNLALPLLAAGQAQKHVTVNEALARLDALVQLAVIDRDRAAPPAEPEEGDRHIVADDATGAWTGWDGSVAAFQGGGWVCLQPRAGWCAFVGDESVVLFHDGAAWQPLGNFIGGIGEVPSFGVGTSPDGVNTFAAKLNSALWTAKTASEGGSGDLRYIMNKEGSSDVLSLLLQSAYEGRAELGLVGDDDLVVKVSADGDTWHEAIRIDRTSGEVDFPSGAVGIEGGGGGEGGGSAADADLTLALLSLEIATLCSKTLVLGDSGNRIAESFGSLTRVDVAGASNLDTATAGVLKSTYGSDILISGATGSVIGDIDNGASNAFDGNTGTPSALKTAAATGAYIGKNFSTAPKKIAKGVLYPSATSGFAGSSIANLTINMRGKNGSAPSSASDGTLLGTTGSFADGSSSKTITSSDTATSWDYVWFQFVSGGGSDSFIFNEAQFYEPASSQDLTVASTSFTAAEVPASARIAAAVKTAGTLMPNENIMLDVSRNGGSNWTEAVLATCFTQPDGMIVLESAEIDLSGQASGTSVKWRARTTDALVVEIHGIHLAWT